LNNAWKLCGEATRMPAWSNKDQKEQVYASGSYQASRLAPFGVDN